MASVFKVIAMALAACAPNPPIDGERTPTLSATTQMEISLTPSPVRTQTPTDTEKVTPSLRPTRTPTLHPVCTIYKFIEVDALPQQREGAYKGWRRLDHPQYHYSVYIPPDWGACYFGEYYLDLFFCDNSCKQLAIGTKFADDETHILRTGVPAGDEVHVGTVQFIGQTIRKTIIRYEGKDKVVLYGYKEDLPYQIPVGNLIFTISLDDVGYFGPYEEVELSPEIQRLADAIVESIRLTSPKA